MARHLRHMSVAVASAVAAALVAGAVVPGSTAGAGRAGSGGDGEAVTLGQMAHLTGFAANSYGIPYDKGLRLGLEQVAESGVLDEAGITLELVTEDVAAEIPAAVTTFNKFVSDGIPIILSPNDTPIARAVCPLVSEADVLFVSGAGPDDVVDNCFFMPDIVTPNRVFGEAVVEMGSTSAVVITNEDNPAFITIADSFVEGFEGAGGEVIERIAVTGDDADFSSVLTNIADAGPDLLYLGTYSEQSGNLLIQMAQFGGLEELTIAGSSAWQAELYDVAGDLAVGALFPSNWITGTGEDNGFEELYREVYDETPGAWAAVGYQAAWVVAATLAMAAESGSGLIGSELAALVPDAAASPIVTEHGAIAGFELADTGIPTYPGVITTFDESGQLAPFEG